MSFRRTFILEAKSMLRFAFFSSLSKLGSMLLPNIDLGILGHYSSESHISYLSQANALLFPLVLFSTGMLLSVGIKTSHAVGSGDTLRVGEVLSDSITFSFCVGLFSTIVIFMGTYAIGYIGLEKDLAAGSSEILRIYGIYMIPNFMGFTFSVWLESIGKPSISAILNWLSVVINFFLDYLLVAQPFGLPSYNSQGVAWASVIIKFIALIYFVIYVLFIMKERKKYNFTIRWTGWWARNSEIIRLALGMGISGAFDGIAFGAPMVMAGWISKEAVAAYGLGAGPAGILFIIAMGMMNAISIRVGYNYGNKDYKRMKEVLFTGYIIIFLYFILTTLLFNLCKNEILNIFTNLESLKSLSSTLMFGFSMYVVGDVIHILSVNCCRSLNDGWILTVMLGIGYLLFVLFAMYFFGFTLSYGLKGIVLSMSFGYLLIGIVVKIRFWYLYKRQCRNHIKMA